MKRTLVAFVVMSMSAAVLADTPVSEADAEEVSGRLWKPWVAVAARWSRKPRGLASTKLMTRSARTDSRHQARQGFQSHLHHA